MFLWGTICHNLQLSATAWNLPYSILYASFGSHFENICGCGILYISFNFCRNATKFSIFKTTNCNITFIQNLSHHLGYCSLFVFWQLWLEQMLVSQPCIFVDYISIFIIYDSTPNLSLKWTLKVFRYDFFAYKSYFILLYLVLKEQVFMIYYFN